MPLNELEEHPYLEYHLDLNYPDNYFEGIIFGTFPVYCITKNLHANEIRFGRNARLQFFYGSKENRLWETLCEVFDISNEQSPLAADQINRVQFAKNLLSNNKLLISDVIKITNRYNSKYDNDFCSLDSSLLNKKANADIKEQFCLNYDIIPLLNKYQSIKHLYFTATSENGNSPFGLFKKIFGKSLSISKYHNIDERLFALDLQINRRSYTAFMLPSPAGDGYRGIHWGEKNQTAMFINYIQRVMPEFYLNLKNINPRNRTEQQKESLTELRDNFFIECRKEAFVNKNVKFKG